MAGAEETATAAPAGRASMLPTALIFGAWVVLAIVFAASSSWYAAFMAVHVIFVVVWIGGGALLTIFGVLAERQSDGEQLATLAKMAAFAGERIFAPAGLVVVAMGIAMVLDAHLGFGHFWIVFGLLGFLATFLIGVGVLAPASKRVSALLADKGPNDLEVQAQINRLLLIARADIAMLLLVVVDMVTKPFS
jgi:uncharacterized membrane protein